MNIIGEVYKAIPYGIYRQEPRDDRLVGRAKRKAKRAAKGMAQLPTRHVAQAHRH